MKRRGATLAAACVPLFGKEAHETRKQTSRNEPLAKGSRISILLNYAHVV
jgi:hypothetical protein